MKRVVVIMFTLLLWIPQVTFASSTRRTVIELNSTRHGPFGRSLYPRPSVSYEGNTLYILSKVTSDRVPIIIEDSEGIPIYKNKGIVYAAVKYDNRWLGARIIKNYDKN